MQNTLLRPTTARLQSLDILRGADLFLLGIFQPLFMAFARSSEIPFIKNATVHFTHVSWEGFALWDLVMPLFMFMAGTSMPFSMGKYTTSKAYYAKVFKRVFILFILGMLVQGNLLALHIDHWRFYSNTLQAIAVGYLISAVILRSLTIRWQIVATFLLLSLYSLLMIMGGDFTQEGNFAEKIDRLVLGQFRDGVYRDESGWHFSPHYHYTWIVSSINFGATVMTGALAGQILKRREWSGIRKVSNLLLWGTLMVVGGLGLSFWMPIIKTIWTTTMVLFTSGLSFILLAVFYYIVDYKQKSYGLEWLKIFGMNSIAAYLLFEVIHSPLNGFMNHFLYGFKQYTLQYYPLLLNMASCGVIFALLMVMYRKRLFLKV